MAFYPTWQADPSQGWQNQFIQQIPQNTPGISAIDFQPQGYPPYQPTTYVQSGLGFDPNYGRSYGAPVQRYDFQSNQIPPINQVSLQSVSFTPAASYAGQVTTASPMLLGGQNDLNKTMSGNDLPGYPRVSSVPQHSLNCNGYSGEFSGNQQPNTQQSTQQQSQSAAPPSAVPQSPNGSKMDHRSNVSTPIHHTMMTPTPRSVPPSPNHHHHHHHHSNGNTNGSSGIPMQATNNHQSSGFMPAVSQANCHPMEATMQWKAQTNGKRTPMEHNISQWKAPSNGSRPLIENTSPWKTPNDDLLSGPPPPLLPHNNQQQQQNVQTGHFLSYSHHLRDISTDSSNAELCLPSVPPNTFGGEPNGGGGSQPHWKSMDAKPPDEFPCAQQTTPNAQHQQHTIHDPSLDIRSGFAKLTDQKSHMIGSDACMSYPSSDISQTHGRNADKPVKKPAAKRQRKKPNASTQSTKQSIDEKKSSNPLPTFGKGTDSYSSAYGPPPNGSANSSSSLSSLSSSSNVSPHFPAFGSTATDIPYQADFKIKQEPLSTIPSRQPYQLTHPTTPVTYPNAQIKMEGYERNYQNFINYADYCQNQSNTSSTPPSVATVSATSQEYGQLYGNYPPYSSSAYHSHSQNYANSAYNTSGTVPNFSSIPSADANCNSNSPTIAASDARDEKPFARDMDKDTNTKCADLTKLTNYEKDIPVHTYPNHGRFAEHHTINEHSHHAADGMKNDKLDDERNSTSNSDLLSNNDKQQTDLDVDNSYGSTEILHHSIDRTEKGMKAEVPDCDCFGPDEKSPPEPGSYYTHLGSAASIVELRADMENRIGLTGRQLRIEKVIYSGKEGKTAQGCPLAKWVIRRVDKEEKVLCIVKRRQGHKCKASFIVVCIVAWDGMPKHEADNSYRLLVHKLNKFGLPTTRRCATNENRTCACQGLDPESSGASFSFGCSWSMYYNGCKYARSKTVRKFRLSVKSEESEIEEHMNLLATMLSPLYKKIAPKAYDNQCKFEGEAPDCRLGFNPGKPFSGVTTCMDFCAHAHRDLHNMQDGCTVQVGLLKPRPPGMPHGAPDDEQLHILPLYIMDTSDEFGSDDAQADKSKTGSVQMLDKFSCEVRVRSTPLLPCRRHGKKRNGKDLPEDELEALTAETPPTPAATPTPITTKKENGCKKSIKNQTKQQQESPSNPLSRAETPNLIATPNNQNNGTLTNNSANNTNINNGSNNSNVAGPTIIGGSLSNTSAFSAPNQNNMLNSNSNLINMASMIDTFTDAQLQSNQISSTVLDSPYSYDYATGSYIDKRNYYNQQWMAAAAAPPPPPHTMDYGYPSPAADRNEQVKSRGSEENPDSTTIINANNSGSAFSPSVDVSKTIHDPLHSDIYAQKEHGFVKPKPPEYPTAYGYHSTQPTYPMYPSYSAPAYNQPHHYNNLDYYNNDKLRYSSFYSPHHHPHQPYSPYDLYHHTQPVQPIPQTPNPPNAMVASNWNLFSSTAPSAPSAVPVLAAPNLSTSPHLTSDSPNTPQNHSVEPSPTLTTLSPTTAPTPQPIEKPDTDIIKSEPIGEISEINDNLECFQDAQMGGVGIALEHGSVLIECAKHEMHATSSLRKPNRKNPTRITLIFYQHRNLNRHRHGIEEWEEKMRLKRLGITMPPVEEAKIEAPSSRTNNSGNGNKNGTNTANKPKSRPRKPRTKADKDKKTNKTSITTESIVKEESNPI